MPPVHKNTNDGSVPVPKIHNKKFVVRTYAMDVAAAKRNMPSTPATSAVPTPPIPTMAVPAPPKPPVTKDGGQRPSPPTPMPTRETPALVQTKAVPVPPTAPAPSSGVSSSPVPAPTATRDLVRKLAAQLPAEQATPAPLPQKQSSADGLGHTQPTPPAPPLTQNDTPEKHTPTLISKLAKRKEAPEIPIDLVISHRNKSTDSNSKSALAKTWTWLTGKSGEVVPAKAEIHENIVVPRENDIGHTPSFPKKMMAGKSPQENVPIFNQEQMPGTQIASLQDAVMVPEILQQQEVQMPAQMEVAKPEESAPPAPELAQTQKTEPAGSTQRARVNEPAVSATPLAEPTPSTPPEIVTSAPAVQAPAQQAEQNSAQQARADLIRQAYQDLAEAEAISPDTTGVGAKAQNPPPRTWSPAPRAQKEPNSPTISPLHTYRMDVADTIEDTGASTTSILARQQNAQPMTEASSTQKEKEKRTLLWFAIGGALLFVLSIIGTGYAYLYHAKSVAPAHVALPVPSLVPTNATKELSGVGVVLLGELSQVAKTPLQNGTIKTVYIATSTRESNGAIEKRPLPGGYLIAAMGLPMPAILMNNTAVDSTVGVVGADNQTYPFFILRVASYDSAFAGMLRWESSLASDMRTLYPSPVENASTSSTSTSTSSQIFSSIEQTPVTSEGFVDETVANHNVRVLRNSSGQSILLYGFANKNTLIIARNAAAFSVLLGKLSQK